jgi:hypothetical protein
MIEINDPATTRIALTALSSGIAQRDKALMRQLEHTQLGNTLIELLTDGRLSQMEQLVNSNQIAVYIDIEALEETLDGLKSRDDRMTKARYLVKNGAPPTMMKFLFGMSVADFRAMRESLNMSAVFGRPESAATDSAADQIAQTWYGLSGHDDLIDRYIALHFHHFPNFKFSILFGVVQELELTAMSSTQRSGAKNIGRKRA